MDLVIEELKKIFDKIYKHEDIPVVAIVTDKDNKILVSATNKRQRTKRICSHAEINVINKMYRKIKTKNLKGYKIYTNLEPCKMCVGAIEQTGLNEVYFLNDNAKFGASKYFDPRIKVVKIDHEYSKYFEDRLKEYFKQLR